MPTPTQLENVTQDGTVLMHPHLLNLLTLQEENVLLEITVRKDHMNKLLVQRENTVTPLVFQRQLIGVMEDGIVLMDPVLPEKLYAHLVVSVQEAVNCQNHAGMEPMEMPLL